MPKLKLDQSRTSRLGYYMKSRIDRGDTLNQKQEKELSFGFSKAGFKYSYAGLGSG